MSDFRDLVGVEAVAQHVGVSPQTIYRWNAAGLMPPATKAGKRRLLWRQADIEKWHAERNRVVVEVAYHRDVEKAVEDCVWEFLEGPNWLGGAAEPLDQFIEQYTKGGPSKALALIRIVDEDLGARVEELGDPKSRLAIVNKLLAKVVVGAELAQWVVGPEFSIVAY